MEKKVQEVNSSASCGYENSIEQELLELREKNLKLQQAIVLLNVKWCQEKEKSQEVSKHKEIQIRLGTALQRTLKAFQSTEIKLKEYETNHENLKDENRTLREIQALLDGKLLTEKQSGKALVLAFEKQQLKYKKHQSQIARIFKNTLTKLKKVKHEADEFQDELLRVKERLVFLEHQLLCEKDEKEAWKQAFKLTCEENKALQADVIFIGHAYFGIEKLQKEKESLELLHAEQQAKEQEIAQLRKSYENAWKQTQEKVVQTLLVKDKEIARIKLESEAHLQKQQMQAHQQAGMEREIQEAKAKILELQRSLHTRTLQEDQMKQWKSKYEEAQLQVQDYQKRLREFDKIEKEHQRLELLLKELKSYMGERLGLSTSHGTECDGFDLRSEKNRLEQTDLFTMPKASGERFMDQLF